jgi:hypothetical protein
MAEQSGQQPEQSRTDELLSSINDRLGLLLDRLPRRPVKPVEPGRVELSEPRTDSGRC